MAYTYNYYWLWRYNWIQSRNYNQIQSYNCNRRWGYNYDWLWSYNWSQNYDGLLITKFWALGRIRQLYIPAIIITIE